MAGKQLLRRTSVRLGADNGVYSIAHGTQERKASMTSFLQVHCSGLLALRHSCAIPAKAEHCLYNMRQSGQLVCYLGTVPCDSLLTLGRDEPSDVWGVPIRVGGRVLLLTNSQETSRLEADSCDMGEAKSGRSENSEGGHGARANCSSSLGRRSRQLKVRTRFDGRQQGEKKKKKSSKTAPSRSFHRRCLA